MLKRGKKQAGHLYGKIKTHVPNKNRGEEYEFRQETAPSLIWSRIASFNTVRELLEKSLPLPAELEN